MAAGAAHHCSKGMRFNFLKDIRKALQMYVGNDRGKQSQYQLMINGIDCWKPKPNSREAMD